MPRKMKDLTGIKYNRLTVIGFSERIGKNYYWNCVCDCGNTKIIVVQSGQLKNGGTKSCGCWNLERVTKHNLDGNPIYHVFNSMKSRCYSIKNRSYLDYGGRGVKICDEWLDDVVKFVEWSNINGYEEGLSIDRIDVNGNYEPSNCRWVDDYVQANNKTDNTSITYNSETRNLCQWADLYNLKRATLCYRLYIANWDIHKALTTPLQKNQYRDK